MSEEETTSQEEAPPKSPEQVEWEAALNSRPFRLLFQWLAKQEVNLKHNWGEGFYTGDTDSKTVQLNSEALGKVAMIHIIQDLDYETLISEIEDEQR